MAQGPTLPYITDADASEIVKKQFEAMTQIMGNVPPLCRVLANDPGMHEGFNDFAGSIFGPEHVPMDLKVLAILRVAELNDCNYCRAYYEGLAESTGLVNERRDAINGGKEPPAGFFNEKESAIVALADEMTRNVQPSRETSTRTRELFGVEGALQLMMIIGLFNLVNRVAGACGLPFEGQ